MKVRYHKPQSKFHKAWEYNVTKLFARNIRNNLSADLFEGDYKDYCDQEWSYIASKYKSFKKGQQKAFEKEFPEVLDFATKKTKSTMG